MDHAIQPTPNGAAGHEQREANLRLIIVSTIGLAVSTVIVLVIVWGMFNLLKSHPASSMAMPPMAPPIQLPPEPRIEEHPWEQLKVLRAHERQVLTTYGWNDKTNGVVHIPIDAAIDAIAAKGLPVRITETKVLTTPYSAAPGSRKPAPKGRAANAAGVSKQ